MASPSTPTHGKYGAIYRLRPNGFKGSGLNDLTFGTGYSGAASAYFEVVIDAADTPDTFKWRKDRAAWTETVNITGSAQTLSDDQTITFAATTGHTATDQWVIGNLKDEDTTEDGTDAQITAAAHRLINPNATLVWSDSGGETMLVTDYSQGKAEFTGNVTIVTVTGANGFILAAALEKVGYLIDWSFNASVPMAAMNYQGQEWTKALPGQATANGSANSFFIGSDSFFDALEEAAEGGEKYFLLQLFNYDPDQDQTGDHHNCWVACNSLAVNAPIGDIVKEAINFDIHGIPSFVANA